MRPLTTPASLILFLLSAWLASAACAQAPNSTPAPDSTRKQSAAPRSQSPAGPTRANSQEQALYQYLISEIAGQRGRPGVAVAGLTDLARKSGDPRIARRALEIAFQNRQQAEAMDAATLWIELEPDSALARQAMAVLLANQGTLDAATASLKLMLADKTKAAGIYLQINQMLSRFTDKQAVLKSVRELAALHPDMAQSHYSLAVAALGVRDADAALKSAQEASRLDGSFQQAAVLTGQLLRESRPAEAKAHFRDYLAHNPAASEVRLALARLLVAEREFADARVEYRALETQLPRDPEIPYAAGLLALQMSDFDAAETLLRKTLGMNLRDTNPVLISLGQVEEARKNWDGALQWYERVTEGEQWVGAQLRKANVLVKQKDLAAGRRFLQESAAQVSDQPAQSVQLVLGESQLLRDVRDYKEASRVLSAALERFPESTEILYDRAMVAEKLDDLAGLERDLRQVIRLKPDYAHAYNALGYTLADRNQRLDEALFLIQKALSLAPQDGFILDSLGWVHFRLGNINQSLAALKQAFALRSDPEIAAHLGEVLWAAGQRDEAMRLWQTSQQTHPGNESLDAVVRRFKQ